MSLTKVNADVLDLTDGYAFTGAVSGAGGWEFVSKVTASSSSTVDFTNMVTGYDYNYVFELLECATDATQWKAQLGIAGPTYRTSTYLSIVSGITTATSGGNEVTTFVQIGHTTQGSTDGEQMMGELTLINPFATSHTNYFGDIHHKNASVARVWSSCGGFYNADESHPAIRFLYASGNITSGNIYQYRRANA